MSAFYYSATFDESMTLLGALCEAGFRVIPGATFPDAHAHEYPRADAALVHALREGPGFYLAGEFTRSPVVLRRLDGGPEAGRYVVDGLSQGPVLEGLLAREVAVDGGVTLLLGYLSFQPQYLNPQTGQWEAASVELKTAHRKATVLMKKLLTKDAAAKFPIGPDALRLVSQGQARLQQHFAG